MRPLDQSTLSRTPVPRDVDVAFRVELPHTLRVLGQPVAFDRFCHFEHILRRVWRREGVVVDDRVVGVIRVLSWRLSLQDSLDAAAQCNGILPVQLRRSTADAGCGVALDLRLARLSGAEIDPECKALFIGC